MRPSPCTSTLSRASRIRSGVKPAKGVSAEPSGLPSTNSSVVKAEKTQPGLLRALELCGSDPSMNKRPAWPPLHHVILAARRGAFAGNAFRSLLRSIVRNCVPTFRPGVRVRDLIRLSATEAAARLSRREITAEQYVRAHLERIEERDKDIGAFVHVAPEAAIRAARTLD